MKLALVARKDFEDAVRDRALHVTAGVFALFGLGIGYAYSDRPTAAGADPAQLVTLLVLTGLFLVPIVALLLSQNDIVGKRRDGELKVLLGLPISRESIVLGTFLGRVAVVAVVVATLFVVSHLVAVVTFAPVDLELSMVAFVLLLVFGVVFVGIGTAISATVRSPTSASGLTVGLFLLFVMPLWNFIVSRLVYVVNGFEQAATYPDWAFALENAEPFNAARNLFAGSYNELGQGFSLFGGPYPQPSRVVFYHEPAFGAVVLLAWLVVPLGLGYLRFREADL
ncbi:ABC transporter permease subunit [Haloarchaeobius sp. HRN-SO-5]|uniref:ABC transporter permease subunit n=1 Tax=Haloarchaeobius sp. HRN-SO-5 TaxID=3446118 RepID=UPI003EC08999